MKYNHYLHIVPTLRRGNASCNAPALPYSTLERLYCISIYAPEGTPERGNDAVSLFRQDGAAL